MKIKIVTYREIVDADYDEWVKSVRSVGIPLDGKQLKETGTWTRTDDYGYTKATSVYSIEKEDQQ
jgi:hypothetical protein